VLVALPAVAAEPADAARCLGQRATIFGSKNANRIKGTKRRDVIAARGGNDVIILGGHGNSGGRDVVCAGRGRDRVIGSDTKEKLIGGRGSDYLEGDLGNDLLVGDQFNPFGDAMDPVGKDTLSGGGGRDEIIGDNFGSRDAAGGRHDEVCPNRRGNGGGLWNADKIIGDSAVMGAGTARGGGNDHICGEAGADLVVGDSYSPSGRARGGGKDALNGGGKSDIIVGDSYTRTGIASGSGNDRVHGLWGNDFLYGDNFASSRFGEVKRGGADTVTGDDGNDRLKGGPRTDICAGGSGRDVARRSCEHKLQIP
jgi:Ca2+-binding RTX toxin-like protein